MAQKPVDKEVAHRFAELVGRGLTQHEAARVVEIGTRTGERLMVDGFRVVNAGSVGMPYEDEPGARWALLGPQIELRRTPYDLDQAAARVAGSSRWGRREDFIRRYVLNRPSAAEASEYFEQLARDGHR